LDYAASLLASNILNSAAHTAALHKGEGAFCHSQSSWKVHAHARWPHFEMPPTTFFATVVSSWAAKNAVAAAFSKKWPQKMRPLFLRSPLKGQHIMWSKLAFKIPFLTWGLER